jgi:hypothetical protein
MTIKALYPAIRPTLSLDFAKSKVLDPRITFTRASTATFVGSNGLIQSAGSGAARFDHNQVTLESLGLLVEEARTNLVLRSEEFDNATWSKGNLTVTANATTAPDGTLTADKLVENTANAERNVSTVATFTGSVVYTFSVFAKAAERSKFQIYLYSGASPGGANFDLATGTTASPGASMVQYPNGWYKCSVTYTHASSGVKGIAILPAVLFSPIGYQGDGVSGLYVWGAQLEAGAFPTSYIPTSGATATRAADLASMTGTNFSSWYRQDEGTMFASVTRQLPAVMGRGDFYSFNDGVAANEFAAYQNSPYTVFYTKNVAGGQNQATSTQSPVAAKSAFGYRPSDTSAYLNGIFTGSIANPNPILNINILKLGNNFNDGLPLNGTIARLAYYPVRLPDAQLQALTAT